MKNLLIFIICLNFATQAHAGIAKELAPIENNLLYDQDLNEKMKIKDDEHYSTSRSIGLSTKQRIWIAAGISTVIIGIIAVAANSSKSNNSTMGTGTNTTTVSVGW